MGERGNQHGNGIRTWAAFWFSTISRGRWRNNPHIRGFGFFLQERNRETKDLSCFDILQKQTHDSGKDSGLQKTWVYLHETLEKNTNLIYRYRVWSDKRSLKIVMMIAQHCECKLCHRVAYLMIKMANAMPYVFCRN